jgi:hypothetical protein
LGQSLVLEEDEGPPLEVREVDLASFRGLKGVRRKRLAKADHALP